jgi:hypothetical protein
VLASAAANDQDPHRRHSANCKAARRLEVLCRSVKEPENLAEIGT